MLIQKLLRRLFLRRLERELDDLEARFVELEASLYYRAVNR